MTQSPGSCYVSQLQYRATPFAYDQTILCTVLASNMLAMLLLEATCALIGEDVTDLMSSPMFITRDVCKPTA